MVNAQFACNMNLVSDHKHSLESLSVSVCVSDMEICWWHLALDKCVFQLQHSDGFGFDYLSRDALQGDIVRCDGKHFSCHYICLICCNNTNTNEIHLCACAVSASSKFHPNHWHGNGKRNALEPISHITWCHCVQFRSASHSLTHWQRMNQSETDERTQWNIAADQTSVKRFVICKWNALTAAGVCCHHCHCCCCFCRWCSPFTLMQCTVVHSLSVWLNIVSLFTAADAPIRCARHLHLFVPVVTWVSEWVDDEVTKYICICERVFYFHRYSIGIGPCVYTVYTAHGWLELGAGGNPTSPNRII